LLIDYIKRGLSMQTVDTKKKGTAATKSAISKPVMAWIVCLCSSLYFFYEFIQLNIFNSLDVYLMNEFHINAVETGHLSSLYFYANLIFLFPAGLLLDRFSTRKLIIMAMIIGSTSTLFFSMSHSLFITAICRFLTGVGAAFCFLSCIRIASRWFPPQKLALATGVIVTMAMLGGAVAQTPFAMLINHVGWRDAMMLNGLLGYGITVLIWFTVKDYPPGESALREAEPKAEKLGIIKSLLFVIKNFQNWVCGLFTALLNLPIFILGAIWGIMYLNQVHHFSTTQASYATAMLFFGTIIGSPLFGFVSDRLLKRKLPMIVGGVASLAVVLSLMYVPDLSLNTVVVLFFMLGFFTSAQILSYPLIAEHNPINMTSTAISIASSCIMISGIIAQPLFGWFMQRNWDQTFVNGHPSYSIQDINNGMLIMPLMFIVSLLLTFFIKESKYSVNEKKELVRD